MTRRLDDEDLEDFVDSIDDIEKTIKALMDGKIDLQEVDKKEAAIKEKKRRLEEQKRLKQEAEERKKRDNARKAERSKWGFVGNWCPRCRKDEVEMMEDVHGKDDTKWPNGKLEKCIMPACSRINDGEGVKLLSNEERRKQLEEKVDQLKKDRLEKAMAKDRWKRWQSTQKYKRAGAWDQDYQRWDKYIDSDEEEDELPPVPPPETAEFKAMEADINERAADKEKRRKISNGFKDKGNKEFAEGNFSKAFKYYTKGLEDDRGNKALLTNRALCAIRLKNKEVTVTKLGEDVKVLSLDQAVEDCTRCLDICEYLHENKGPSVSDARLKSLMRRAEAKSMLGRFGEAVEDVEFALSDIPRLNPAHQAELKALMGKYKEEHERKLRIEELEKMAGVAADDKREVKQEGEGVAAGEKAEKVEEKAKVEEKVGAGNVGVSKQGSKGARKLQIEEEDDESDEETDAGKGKGKEEAFDESDFVERMKGLVTDPLMVAAMKDPKMVAIFEEMQASGTPMTDEEILKKYPGDEKIHSLLKRVNETMGTAKPPPMPGIGGEDTQIQPEVLDKMKNDPEFLKALKDPKMQGMFAQMLKDPASMADFQGDADFCRLEDALQKLMPEGMKMPDLPAAASSKMGGKNQAERPGKKEERMKGVVSLADGLKQAVEGASGAGGDREACARAAASLLAKAPSLLDDEDGATLFTARGGAAACLDLCLSSVTSTTCGKAALGVLALLCRSEREADVVLGHKGGRALILFVAWMQGVESKLDLSVRIAAALVLEVALQHEAVRKALVPKTWGYTPTCAAPTDGEGGSSVKVSLTRAVGGLMGVEGGRVAAMGVIVNMSFEDKGKEQLTNVSCGGKRVCDVAFDMLKMGGKEGGGGEAARSLLNLSTHAPFRRHVASLGVASLIAALDACSIGGAVKGGAQAEDMVGVLVNLGLDDDLVAAMGKAGAVSSLLSILTPRIKSAASTPGVMEHRCATLASRLARVPLTAVSVRESGLLASLLVVVHRARGASEDATAQAVLDSCVRCLAQCLRGDPGCANALCSDAPQILTELVGLLKNSREGVVGNAALALQIIANDESRLEALCKAGAVAGLLDVVHHRRGAAQKNAGLALGRIVKRPEGLKMLKALHGLEILNAYLQM